MKLHTYLTFNGQAEQAILFYAKAFNTSEPKILKFSDMPPNPNMPIPEEVKNFVMHTEIEIAGTTIKMCDTMPNAPAIMGNNSQIAITFENESDFDFVYSVLSDGANIMIPVGPAFFAVKYVYFTDKFGVLWHLMIEKN